VAWQGGVQVGVRGSSTEARLGRTRTRAPAAVATLPAASELARRAAADDHCGWVRSEL
jgi:hypothetical protein